MASVRLGCRFLLLKPELSAELNLELYFVQHILLTAKLQATACYSAMKKVCFKYLHYQKIFTKIYSLKYSTEKCSLRKHS